MFHTESKLNLGFVRRMPVVCMVAGCLLMLSSCHKSLRQRAVEDAREYTRKYCPTPVDNCVRTDSTAFILDTDTYTYYCSLTDRADDSLFVAQHRDEIVRQLSYSIRNSIGLQRYKRAGFSFRYVCRSATNPSLTLLDLTITKEQYN